MRLTPSIARLAVALVALASIAAHDRPLRAPRHAPAPHEAGAYPSDWFGQQRAFPNASIPQERWVAALEMARVERAAAALGTSSALLTWQLAGPTNIGGRVSAIVAAPAGNPVYLGAANGGVFKSADFGVTWEPIFDQLGVPSIGALALDPTDDRVLYAGTGESNAAIDNYDGNGLFRTRDAGLSWEYVGLEATRRIARVAVDPLDPNRLYVAAMGSQFSTGPDRGLYRSLDGGATWSQVLFVSDSTGACDVVVNPAHPDTVFCATWERVRRPSYRRVWGPSSGIWRSTDRGATWTRLLAGLPAASDTTTGRIGLAIARSRPSTIYAQIMASDGSGRGLYRSTNGGTNWTRRDLSGFTGGFGGFGWYFGDCAADPVNPDRVYALGVYVMRSTNGGANFVTLAGDHPDQHALWISPLDPARMYLGNDGGFYTSADTGATWTHASGLPISQFYAGTIDPSNPARLLGGTQDNSTLITTGPPNAWNVIFGGDGFYSIVDPTNPNIIFAEYQNGTDHTGPQRSTNGGGGFTSPTGIVSSDRFNWSAPFVMDPNNHNVLLAGSQRVYRSVNNGVTYAAISGDLTTNPVALLPNYGTITTLAISAADGSFYLAGTDDGRVWRSTNAGASWIEITAGLPRRWVSRVVADPVNPQVCYVTLSGFSQDERLAHVYRSGDRGDHWTAIGANLPDAPVNDLIVDPTDPQTLFVGSDVGVWVTRSLGDTWFPLGQGLPLQAVHDLTLHAPSRTLVAATHGRSQWKLDLTQLPVAVAPRSTVRLAFASPSPNPSRSTTRFALDVPEPTHVSVVIYDAFGRRVRTLADRTFESGRHALAWDGADARGCTTPPGVYFARAAAAGWAVTRRTVRVE